MAKKKPKLPEVKLIGDYSWTEVRETLIWSMNKARTQKEFEMVLSWLLASSGQTKKEMVKKRKERNISVTKEFLEQLKKEDVK